MKTITIQSYEGKTKTIHSDDLTWRPSAYAIAVHEAQVLLVKQAGSELYMLPGGGVELGETVSQALKREVLEETGVNVSVYDLLTFAEDFFYYDPLEQGFQTLLFYYRCEAENFTLIENDEIEDESVECAEWVKIDQLSAESFFHNSALTYALINQIANG